MIVDASVWVARCLGTDKHHGVEMFQRAQGTVEAFTPDPWLQAH
jgi:hypothetical protein